MTEKKKMFEDTAALRQRAEDKLKSRSLAMPEDIAALSPEDIRKTLHELSVHQIELEMQNEALRATQAELEKSQSRYFDLYDLAPVGYCTLSEQGLILEANLTATTLLGMARNALVKEPISRFILNEDQDTYYLHRKKLFETGETQECELRLVRPDDALIWVHLTATAAQAEDGAPPVCRAVLIDITDRKRAEQALQDSNRQLERARRQALAEKMTADLRKNEQEKLLILENTDEIIAYHDRDLCLVWANKKYLAAVRTATGLPATVEDVKGKKCFDAWGLGKECNHCPVGEAIRTGTSREAKLTPQNQPHWPATLASWSIRAAPVRDSAGTIIGAIEMAHDITDKLQAEDELRDSEERYRILFEQLPVGVVTLDVETQLPVAFNDMTASQLGYSREEFSRLKISDYEAVENPEQTRACIERLLQHGENRFETLHRTKTGEIRNVLVNMRHTRIKGQSFFNGVFQDITAEKQAEQEIIARKAAEASNRHKSQFLSNMSHEIRTPMNAIMGFAQILDRDPSLTPGQKKQIRIINRSGHHLLRLIDDILDISRIESGKIELKPIVFGLEDFLDDVENMFRSRADAKGLELIVERDAGLPGWVRGDEGKLRQVLVNLLGNAIKFTESGRVSMRVRSEPAAEPAGEDGKPLRLVFEVEDSGPGIPASEQERIFYAFEQVASAHIIEGTGLGLAISRKLVEIMGGTLAVESVVGKGSCFHVSVLCEPAEVIQKSEAPESPNVVGLEPGSGPWRVLVVDDVPSNRDLLDALLSPLGFEIREAENGAEAIDIFEAWAPHVVLMDMRMPVMDGYEATRRIKATETGRTTPVIAVTASVLIGGEDEVLAMGVSAYLHKPFKPEELYEVLGECLDLRYVYADEPSVGREQPKTPALTQKSLTALPRDLIQDMAAAVDEGDTFRLAELIRRVEPLDSTAAQGLKALAGRYDYTTLTELLKQGENDHE